LASHAEARDLGRLRVRHAAQALGDRDQHHQVPRPAFGIEFAHHSARERQRAFGNTFGQGPRGVWDLANRQHEVQVLRVTICNPVTLFAESRQQLSQELG
jgi:hypothetical protein